MKLRAELCLVLALGLVACGQMPAARPSPSPATSSPSPTLSPLPSPVPSPAPPVVTAGAPAWVSVAPGWRTPKSPRAVDAPSLENPARVRDWIAGMSAADQSGLIDRLDTQLLLGDEVAVLELQSGWARVVVPGQSWDGRPKAGEFDHADWPMAL